tara:strand:+ start:1423 stop:1764 length:342 start_codon:yes stop_codon:yes gene_type:complete
MKKVLINILFLVFLSGCFQNTAMLAPGITLVSTGNLPQTFGTYLTNKAVEEETGMQTHEFIVKKVEEQHVKSQDKRINKELSVLLESNIKNKQLLILLENNIKKTRKKITELN